MFYIKKKVHHAYLFSKIGDLWYLKKMCFLENDDGVQVA